MAKKAAPEETISRDQAKLVLENVFSACSVPPNSVPMEILEEDIKHNRFFTRLTRFLALAAIVGILIIPVVFSKASISCSLGMPRENSVRVTVNAAAFLPITGVRITLDGEPVEYVRDGGHFTVDVTENGTLLAEITTLNNQTAQAQAEIQAFAAQNPSIVSHGLEDGTFRFHVEPGSYPVDYAGIYALDEGGGKLYPSSWDEASGEVVFEHVSGVTNFFVPDKKGNVLQAILTPAN